MKLFCGHRLATVLFLIGRLGLWGMVSALGLSEALSASEGPRTVPVKIQVNTVATVTWKNGCSAGPTVYYAQIDASLNGEMTSSGPAPEDHVLPSPVTTPRLEPGKVYTLTVTATVGSNSSVKLIPPPGYVAVIDGLVRSQITGITTGTKTYPVRVFRPEQQLSAPAGTASNLSSDRLGWQVALGGLRNGGSAGAISLVGSGTSNWDTFYTPEALYYEPTADDGTATREVYVYRVGGLIRQIAVNEAVLDVVTLSGTSYELRFYHPTQAVGTTYPKTFTGLPFVTYRIAQDTASANKLRITKETRSLLSATETTAPIARTEWTTLERTGAAPAFTWEMTPWTLDGATPVARERRVWAGNASGGYDELHTVVGPDNVPVMQVTRVVDAFDWGDGVVSETVGTTAAVKEERTYHTNATERGSYGFPKTSSATGGGWQAMEYFPTSDDLKIGTVRHVYGPWLDAPLSPTAASLSPTNYPGVVTTHDYDADAFGLLRRPKSTETRVGGVLTSKSTVAYSQTVYAGAYYHITATRTDLADPDSTTTPAAALTTVTKYFREDTFDPFFRDQVHAVTSPDGVRQSYVRQRGTYNPATGVFTRAATGRASRIGTLVGVSASTTGATQFTTFDTYAVEPLWLIAGKSTAEFIIRDEFARVARIESHVWNGSSWQLVSWQNLSYNLNHQLVARASSNGELHQAGYSGERLVWERDPFGILTNYGYDAGGRRITVTHTDTADQPLRVVTTTYDASGRRLSETLSVAPGVVPAVAETIQSTWIYDMAGRVVAQTTPNASAPAAMTYDPVNRVTTATDPTGATRVETKHRDGRMLSQTGTGSVPEFYTYAIAPGTGHLTTTIRLSTADSPRWASTVTDALGRVRTTTRPAPPTTTNPSGTRHPAYTETRAYHATNGRLLSVSRPGLAAILYEYDPLGRAIRSGLDVDGNGSLVLASSDRISDSDETFVFENSAWWRQATGATYEAAGSATPTPVGVTKTRLSNFGFDTANYPNLRAHTLSTDAEGNTTVSTTQVNRATRTVTSRVRAPGLAADQIDTTVNGLALSRQTPDGLLYETAYDALGRAESAKDPRTAPHLTRTTYWPGTTLTKDVTDPADIKVADYLYDTAGRPHTTKNALNHATYTRYNLRGQITHVWGPATSPVHTAYNDFGERVALYTYRDATGLGHPGTAAWPTTTPAASPTTWTFDPASGVLLQKQDALAASVAYTYDAIARVATRQWARHRNPTDLSTPALDSPDRLTTTYVYHAYTGDLLSTSYNGMGTAETPTRTHTYTRTGRVASITNGATAQDEAGTHTFVYDFANNRPWRLVREELPAYLANRVFTTLYEASTSATVGTVTGRARGFQLGALTAPAAVLEQSGAINNLGRLATVTSLRDGNAAITAETFTYSYTPQSRLLAGVSAAGAPGVGFGVSRVYDSRRDLLTSIETTWAAGTLSRYDYTHTDLGQRDIATQSGSAFADYGGEVVTDYGYDERGQVTSAATTLGASPSATLPGRQFAYDYDGIGNRTSANRTGDPAHAEAATANAANQLVTREHKGRSFSGTVPPGVTVAVDGAAPARQGNYWERFLAPDNTGNPIGRTLFLAAHRAADGKTALATRTFLLPARTETLTYDRDGNLLSDAQWDYFWDAENRLVRMENKPWTAWLGGPPAQRISFRYDYQGRRIGKKVETQDPVTLVWSTTSELRFLYQGWNLVAETDAAGAVLRSYTWGLDLMGSLTASGGVGALLQVADHAADKRYFPAYDGNGNVAALVNAASGTVAASYEYSPFGETLRAPAEGIGAANPFRFSTKYTDAESGLIYYGYRYYDSGKGRFINRDPIEERGGLNLYGFCGNDSINGHDVLGMFLGNLIKKAFNWIKRNITSIIGAILYVINPVIGIAWSAAVGYYYGGVKGLAIGLVSGWVGGQIAGGLGLGKFATSVIAGGFAGSIAAGLSGGNVFDGFLSGATAAAVFTLAMPQIQKGVNIAKEGLNVLKNASLRVFDAIVGNPNLTKSYTIEIGDLIFEDDPRHSDYNSGPKPLPLDQLPSAIPDPAPHWEDRFTPEQIAKAQVDEMFRDRRHPDIKAWHAINDSMRETGMGAVLKYGANEFYPVAGMVGLGGPPLALALPAAAGGVITSTVGAVRLTQQAANVATFRVGVHLTVWGGLSTAGGRLVVSGPHTATPQAARVVQSATRAAEAAAQAARAASQAGASPSP